MSATTRPAGGRRKTVTGTKTPPDRSEALAEHSSSVDQTSPAPHPENPLVPNLVLRELYRKLIQARAQSKHKAHPASKSGKKRGVDLGHRQEASRLSFTHDLTPGDLVMDSRHGTGMAILLGEAASTLDGASSTPGNSTRSTRETAKTPKSEPSKLLPIVEDGDTRLFTGTGVALALQSFHRTAAVLIYVEHREASNHAWRRALTIAAKQVLPIIFLVLPARHNARSKVALRNIADTCGVPCVPVDAIDAVALYRVAQESLLRLRSGGGPVLIEALQPPEHGSHKVFRTDAVAQLKHYLLQRQVCTEAWINQVERDLPRTSSASASLGRKSRTPA